MQAHRLNAHFSSLLFLPFLLFSACAEDDKDESPNIPSADVNLEIEATTDTQGRATMSFISGVDINKIAITAEGPSGSEVRFTQVRGGSDSFLGPRGEIISLSGEPLPFSNTVSIPSRSVDPQLQANTRFDVAVEISGVGNANSNSRVQFYVTSRKDTNLRSGSMRMNIFYVGEIGAESSTKSAVQEALREARNILSSSAGISLVVEEFDIDGPTTVTAPFTGDNLYLNATRQASSPAVNTFIVGDIRGSGSGSVLGIAGGIPGPAIPSRKSAVAISIFTAAGIDGFFDQDDLFILGETIAHEAGHQMGLFHPIDFSGSEVSGVDPLSDTPECSFRTQCVNNEALATNLMYPNPLVDNTGRTIRQNRLSEDQRGVLNRYIAVD